jgi:hypothetical protein
MRTDIMARGRHKPFSAPRKRPGFKLGAHFLLRFMRDSGGLGAGLTGLMAKNSDHLAGTFEAENTGGVLSGFLAEENDFDRRTLWRIGSWGAAAVAAVVVAVMANQTSLGWRRDQFAAADLSRQAQQLQALTRESQNEARRLTAAIDTLNSDRDRLYSRVTVLEQGLDSVTGAIVRQNSGTASPTAAPRPAAAAEAPPPAPSQAVAPAVAPVTTTVAPVTTTVAPVTTAAPVTTTAAPAAMTVLAKTDPAPKMDRPRTEAKIAEAKFAEVKTAEVRAMEQNPAIAAPAPPTAPAASTAPAATSPTPAAPLIAAKSILAPPDPGAPKMIEPDKPVVARAEDPPPDATASVALKDPDTWEGASPNAAVQRTEFAVDVGSANSIGGLRALWRGLVKSNSELAALRPIIMVKESATGLGMQLRLAAGPLSDAAAAAKICAALIESQRDCETTVFDGQRLAMKAGEQQPPSIKPAPPQRRSYYSKRAKRDDPPPKLDSTTLSRWFVRDKP